MRKLAACTLILLAIRPATRASDVVAPATAPASRGAAAVIAARALLAANDVASAERLLAPAVAEFSADADLRLAWIDAALLAGRPTVALERLAGAPRAWHSQPEFQWRAAQALAARGPVLGQAEVRTVRNGRAGQFIDGYLLVEPRPGDERFLCCGPDAALYQLRQALDAGLNEPAAHVLHARLWQQLGRPELGLAVLKNRAAELLHPPTATTLAAFSELALAAGALPDFLRYERLRAELDPDQHDAIRVHACLVAAERYSQAGDEALYLEWLRRARELRPLDTDLLLRVADAAWEAGQARAAAADYGLVLRLQPDHPQRSRILGLLAEARTEEAAP